MRTLATALVLSLVSKTFVRALWTFLGYVRYTDEFKFIIK